MREGAVDKTKRNERKDIALTGEKKGTKTKVMKIISEEINFLQNMRSFLVSCVSLLGLHFKTSPFFGYDAILMVLLGHLIPGFPKFGLLSGWADGETVVIATVNRRAWTSGGSFRRGLT